MNNENNTYETDNTNETVAQVPQLDAARIAEINAIMDEPAVLKRFTESTWSQVLPGLFQGGTEDHDTVATARRGYEGFITKDDFDFVVTLYVYAQPVDSWVHEVRYGIYDGNMADFDVEDIKPIVAEAHRQWKAGRRVLIRCQAGWNRSGLIMALVLMWEGFTADQAIRLIRRARGAYAMGNSTFEQWLTELDIQAWKS